MPEIDHLRVRERRDELELSNVALAEMLGTTANNVRTFVSSDGRKLSRRLIYKLSRALDLPVEEIVVQTARPAATKRDQASAA